jgi:hypothetical protein
VNPLVEDYLKARRGGGGEIPPSPLERLGYERDASKLCTSTTRAEVFVRYDMLENKFISYFI